MMGGMEDWRVHGRAPIYRDGYRIPDTGFQIPDSRNRIPDTGYQIPDTRYRIPDTGSRVMSSKFSVYHLSPWPPLLKERGKRGAGG